jgi:hypothetical protein
LKEICNSSSVSNKSFSGGGAGESADLLLAVTWQALYPGNKKVLKTIHERQKKTFILKVFNWFFLSCISEQLSDLFKGIVSFVVLQIELVEDRSFRPPVIGP